MPAHASTVSRTVHWAIAISVLGALATGYALTRSGTFVLPLIRLHLGLGLSAGFLSAVRVLLWFAKGAPPGRFLSVSRLQSLAGNSVHAVLRLLPLLLLVSGLGMIAISGVAGSLAAGTLNDLGALKDLPPRSLHHKAALVLLLLTGLHVAAACWHWLRQEGVGARSKKPERH